MKGVGFADAEVDPKAMSGRRIKRGLLLVQVRELESPGIAWLRWRDFDWRVHYLPRPASVLMGAAEASPSMTVFSFSSALIIKEMK